MNTPYDSSTQNADFENKLDKRESQAAQDCEFNNQSTFSENKAENNNFLLITSTENSIAHLEQNHAAPPSDSEWGIDTVSLFIRATDNVPELAHNSWQQIEGKQNAKADKTCFVSNFAVGYANVRVAYMPVFNAVFLQFNAARIQSRKSADLLPPNALKPLVESLLFDLVPQIPVLPEVMHIDQNGSMDLVDDWSKHVKLTRLDCARNLYVDCPEYLKHALSSVKSKYQKTVHIYFDNVGWTRSNTTKSAGQDRIYDKSAELRNLELEERFHWDRKLFRFESQLQGDRLLNFGLKTLDRVSDESVWHVLDSRWESCGWGIKLPGKGSFDFLLDSLAEKERIPFVGFLALKAEGMGDMIEGRLNRRFAKISEKLGIVPGLPISAYRSMTKRLSLWHGTSIEVDEGV